MLKAVHGFVISKDQLHGVLRQGRRLHRIGRDVDLRVWRDGTELHIELELHMMAEERDPLPLTPERINQAREKAPMRRCPRCGWALRDEEPDGLCMACTGPRTL